jgi:hypothetical protein
MDQKPIVLYLRISGSQDERDGSRCHPSIHNDLVRTLGKDAVTYSTVTKYAHSVLFSGRKEITPPEAPDVERSHVDDAILTALVEFPFPFSSVRELLRRICLPRSTVHRAPAPHAIISLHGATSSMGPPLLTAEQKQIRAQMTIELLQVLSMESKARASVTILSPWTSHGFICSVSMI